MSVLTHEKDKKVTKKQVNTKDQKDLKEIIAMLDNIPDPVGPLEPHTHPATRKTTCKRTGRGIKVHSVLGNLDKIHSEKLKLYSSKT